MTSSCGITSVSLSEQRKKEGLSALLFLVRNVECNKPDNVLRRVGNATLPVFDASLWNAKKFGESPLREAGNLTQRLNLTH